MIPESWVESWGAKDDPGRSTKTPQKCHCSSDSKSVTVMLERLLWQTVERRYLPICPHQLQGPHYLNRPRAIVPNTESMSQQVQATQQCLSQDIGFHSPLGPWWHSVSIQRCWDKKLESLWSFPLLRPKILILHKLVCHGLPWLATEKLQAKQRLELPLGLQMTESHLGLTSLW